MGSGHESRCVRPNTIPSAGLCILIETLKFQCLANVAHINHNVRIDKGRQCTNQQSNNYCTAVHDAWFVTYKKYRLGSPKASSLIHSLCKTWISNLEAVLRRY